MCMPHGIASCLLAHSRIVPQGREEIGEDDLFTALEKIQTERLGGAVDSSQSDEAQVHLRTLIVRYLLYAPGCQSCRVYCSRHLCCPCALVEA